MNYRDEIDKNHGQPWRRKPMSVDAILSSPIVNAPLRQYMYCNPNEGAAAVCESLFTFDQDVERRTVQGVAIL